MQDPAPGKADHPAVAITRDGTNISYRLLTGAGKGRCVLIHSLAMDLRNAGWCAPAAAKCRTLAHGRARYTVAPEVLSCAA